MKRSKDPNVSQIKLVIFIAEVLYASLVPAAAPFRDKFQAFGTTKLQQVPYAIAPRVAWSVNNAGANNHPILIADYNLSFRRFDSLKK